jgi:hypothetical protein
MAQLPRIGIGEETILHESRAARTPPRWSSDDPAVSGHHTLGGWRAGLHGRRLCTSTESNEEAPLSMLRLSRIAALTACLALAAPAAASADAGDNAGVPSGAEVVNQPTRLSLGAAGALRDRIDRTGRFPAAPRLVLGRAGRARLVRGAAPAPVRTPAAGAGARMFGSEAAYAYKRDAILGAIQSFNATLIPTHGGRYVPPALYELDHGAQLPGCGDGVYNGAYCPAANTLGWSMAWTNGAFAQSGDMAWATLIAHEYGHAAQGFLGIRGGWMAYRLYSESFADCMAGAFFFWAYSSGLTDTVGRGDGNEFRDAFAWLQSSVTTLDTHGTIDWRYALAIYGWNTGFDGCVNWARSIDGV